MTPLEIADMFCGGGGSCTGIIKAVERMGKTANIIAVNHWEMAIQTHSTNHAQVRHYCESVERLDPVKIVPGQTLDLLWASPACTHHSVARGGRPRSEQQRAPAWTILNWLELLKVKRLIIENVTEFEKWGPLDENGRTIKAAAGETFKAFINAIRSLGYTVEWRTLNAANYGDPTVRRRLFIQAIKGTGRYITWPDTTHDESRFNVRGLPQWIPAREIIDWSIPGESIFARKKPLAPATLRRIEHGIKKFWQPYAEPFLVMLYGASKSQSLERPLPTITAGGNHAAIIQPFITRFHGGKDSAHRNHSINEPIPVIDTSNRYAIIEPFILPNEGYYRGNRAHGLDEPMTTATASRGVGSLISPFLVKYYGSGNGAASVDIPLGTITTKNHFALVEPDDEHYLDIRFRMLQPHEIAKGQGFPSSYIFKGTKADQIKQIGNANPVHLSAALAENILSLEVA